MADVDRSKRNPPEQQVLHLAACLCSVLAEVSEGCKPVGCDNLWNDIYRDNCNRNKR